MLLFTPTTLAKSRRPLLQRPIERMEWRPTSVQNRLFSGVFSATQPRKGKGVIEVYGAGDGNRTTSERWENLQPNGRDVLKVDATSPLDQARTRLRLRVKLLHRVLHKTRPFSPASQSIPRVCTVRD
jgi:hypothetical protein